MRDIIRSATCHKDSMLIFQDYLPRRLDQFNIQGIPSCLWANIYILDALENGRLQIHLAGTGVENGFGIPLRGRYMDEFSHGPESASVLEAFQQSLVNWQDMYLKQTVCMTDRPMLTIQASIHPLQAHRQGIDAHIAGLLYVEYPSCGEPCGKFQLIQQTLSH